MQKQTRFDIRLVLIENVETKRRSEDFWSSLLLTLKVKLVMFMYIKKTS